MTRRALRNEDFGAVIDIAFAVRQTGAVAAARVDIPAGDLGRRGDLAVAEMTGAFGECRRLRSSTTKPLVPAKAGTRNSF